MSCLKSWEYFLTISFINHAINPPFPLLNDVLAALIAFWSLPVIKIVPISFKTFFNYANLLKFLTMCGPDPHRRNLEVNVRGSELGVQETTSVFPPLSGWRKAPLTKPSLLMGPRERRQGRVSLCKESLSTGSMVVQHCVW